MPSQLPQLAQQRAEVLVSGTTGADSARAAIGSLGLLRSAATTSRTWTTPIRWSSDPRATG